MPLIKNHKPFNRLKNKKYLPLFLLLIFSVLFFATRLPGLKDDVINPDGAAWHYRSEQFIVGIKNKQFEKTYQHYHPGVTLMWIAGTAVEVYKKVSGVTAYDISNFPNFDLVSKISVISVQFLLTLLLIYLLSKIIGFKKSILTVSLFTFEPFFIGNSRLYHMDILLTLLLLNSILLAYLNMKNPGFWKSILTGFFLALSFLTKSLAIGALFFVVFYTIFYLSHTDKKDKIFSTVAFIVLSFIIFVFALFPALWVKPVYFLSDIFKEVARVGVRKGHEQLVMGEYTERAGILFYPLVILLKTSPFLILGVILCVYFFVKSFHNLKKKFRDGWKFVFDFNSFLFVFYLGYFLGMSFFAKKIDRYMLIVFPFLSYCAVIGYKKFYQNLKSFSGKRVFRILLFLLIVFFVGFPIINLYPYYFTYTSPLFGTSENANKIIGQKPFGVGIPKLKEVILERYSDKYGGEPKLGFYDSIPMKTIYPNSKVFDVRTYGPSNYDLLILAINEEMPEKVLENKQYVFEKDYSLWINGLEYWRIYVKKEVSK